MTIRNWSTVASSNNSAPPDGWPEGQSPSSVNNCARQMMASIRDSFEQLPYFDFGHTPTRIDGDTFTVATDLTATYYTGRRVKLVGATTGYATISSSSYSVPDTTVNVTMDSGNIPTSLATVSVGTDTTNSPFLSTAIRYEITPAEQAAGVTPVNYYVIPGYVSRYGSNAIPGTTDMSTALANAVAQSKQSGGAPVVFDSIFHIGSTTTVDGPLIEPPPQQIFSATSLVAFSKKSLIRAFTEWWGAVGDGSTNDAPATQKAFKAASDAGYIPVQLLAKNYKWSSQIFGQGSNTTSFSAVPLYGIAGHGGGNQTTITCSGLGAGISALKYRGGSGAINQAQVRDIFFTGDSNTICLEFAGQNGMRAVRCRFGVSAEGIRFHNEDVGSFTEYCVADNCVFDAGCITKIRYKVTAGNNSFHGSGMANRCTAVSSTGNIFLIDSGCFVYNAPADLQVWTTGSTTVFNSAASVPNASFHGTLTFENGGGTLTLGSGQQVAYVGTVQGIGTTTTTGASVVGGTMVRCGGVAINGDSSMTMVNPERNYRTALTTGANTMTSVMPGYSRMVNMRLSAANYEYFLIIGVVQSPSGGTASAVIISTLNAFNVAGYGAPTVSTTVGGDLIITNGAYPASGVTAIWNETAMSPGFVSATNLQF